MQAANYWFNRIGLTRHRPDGFQALEMNFLLSQFAVGMVSVLGVVYIYQLGENLKEGLGYVLGFYGLQRLVVVIFLPLVGWLINTLGYRKTILLGSVALVGRLLLMAWSIKAGIYVLAPALILGGFYIPAYFTSFHGLFLDDGDKQHVGAQIGLMEVLKRLSMVAAPFVAGVLADKFGFFLMFGVSVMLLMISLLPVLMMPHHKHRQQAVGFEDIFAIIVHHPRYAGSIFFWYFAQATVMFMWPIYLFEVVGNLEVLGSVTSVSMIFSSLSIYIFGKLYDARPLHRVFPVLSLIVGIIWSMRFLVSGLLEAATADVMGRFSTPMWWMKIRKYELELGETMDSVSFGLSHELLVSLGLMSGLLTGYFLMAATWGFWPILSAIIIFGVFAGAYMVSGWKYLGD